MKSSFILILTLFISLSSYAVDDGKDNFKGYTECVNVWGPDILDLEDFEKEEKIDKDDRFTIPEGWTPVSNTSTPNGATIILLCR